jgi:uncharacterized protein YbaP (TraB family)
MPLARLFKHVAMVSFAGLTAIVLAAPAAANISCGGSSLWKATPAAVRQQLTAQAHSEPFPVGRYFRIERGNQVSYLLGTVHVPPIKQLRLPNFVIDQVGKSGAVYLEKSPKEFAAFEKRLKTDPLYAMAGGMNGLSQYFTPQQWAVVLNSTVDAGLKRGFADTLNPWFLYDRIEGLGCGQDNGTFQLSLDERVMRAAQNRKIPMAGLETPEKVDRYYQALSIGTIVTMMKSLPPQNPNFPHGPVGKGVIELLAAEEIVLAQRFDEWVESQYLDTNGIRLRADFRDRKILLARNQAWMPTLTAAFNAGGAFVAVGAAHLNGRYGLLAMLQKKGFKITRIALN